MIPSSPAGAALGLYLLVSAAAVAADPDPLSMESDQTGPTSGTRSVILEPVPPRSAPRRSRAVFVCRDAEAVIFSDLPCGPGLDTRNVDTTDPGPGRAASTRSAAAPAATRPQPEPARREYASDGHDRQCAKLHDQLAQLDERMRTGYSAREAARLWNRWRELHRQIYALRC
jgi:hypothetical protein